MGGPLTKLKIDNHVVPSVNVDWNNIPQLVVLTGVNGSGKTQLLQAIQKIHLCNLDSSLKQRERLPYRWDTDLRLSEEEFGFVPWNQGSLSSLGASGYAEFEKEMQNFAQTWTADKSRNKNDQQKKLSAYFQKHFNVDLAQVSDDFFGSLEYKTMFRKAWIYNVETIQNAHIQRLFVQYKMNFSEQIEESYNPETGGSLTQEQIEQKIGIPPWIIINQLFQRYGFKYRINFPERSTSQYAVGFHLEGDESKPIPFGWLSSGEQMIVTLILWSYSEELGRLKKLLILDEPDAHLHPQMAKMFKEILSDILVKKFGIQVIFTTHSPTTLCWIDEGNIFLMDPVKGVYEASKAEALDKLTSGLLFVHNAFKIILVENKDDETFHQQIYDELAYEGKLPKNPQLRFKSVVTPSVNEGGKSVVINACKQWENFASKTELNGVLLGLVDKDNDDNSSLPNSVGHLPRYCYENFLADPIVIFTMLIEEKFEDECIKPLAEKLGYRRGDTLKFKSNLISDPQVIVDTILQAMTDDPNCSLKSEDIAERIEVSYVNNMRVFLPKYFLDQSGKDTIWHLYRQAFPRAQAKINASVLINIAIKTHLIPCDLKSVYSDLINAN